MAFPSRNAPCRCGSGRKYKRCCYAADAASIASAEGRPQAGAIGTPLAKVIGIPGEEMTLTITPVFADGREPSPAGTVGSYDVVMMLRGPDAMIEPPANFSFETTLHTGTSMLAISHPAITFSDQRFNTFGRRIDLRVFTGEGEPIVATGYPNAEGFLSDIRVTIAANSFVDAAKRASLTLTPAISALSLAGDVPLIFSHTVIREVGTGVVQRSVALPFRIAAVELPHHGQTPEARTLFNRYRDAINSDDPNWRLLCFASVVEQLWKQQRARVAAGGPGADLESIRIPTDRAEVIAWVKASLPQSYDLPDDICLAVVPNEARGLTTNEVAIKFIRPLRSAVAHSLLEDGMLPTEVNDVEHLMQVRKWTGLLRCITRVHLSAVYGIPAIPGPVPPAV